MRELRFFRKMVSAAAVGILFTASVFAIPYESYTYLPDAQRAYSPHAYIPKAVEDGSGFGFTLNEPQDICEGFDGAVIICDTGNNRILRVYPEKGLYNQITGFVSGDIQEAFNFPRGVYEDSGGLLYIADSGNGRIVVLDKNGALQKLIGRPKTDFIDDSQPYIPLKVTADKFKRVYVVAEDITMGLVTFGSNGEFSGFLGSQRVSYNLSDYLWKRFMTDAQKQRMRSFVPMTYSNAVCDENGFVYAVNTALDPKDLETVIRTGNTEGKTTPVKKLNPAGNDVLLRTGHHSPVGDLDLIKDENGDTVLSSIVDVAIGDEGTYTMLDGTRNRIFTYSSRGELLFAFSGKSEQAGNTISPVAVCYSGTDMIVLDQKLAQYTIFSRTQYGDALIKALSFQNRYLFEEAFTQWQEVLKYNPDSNIAQCGVGMALLNNEEYRKAMNYFDLAENKEQYSRAFEGYRRELIGNNPIIIILIFIAVFAAIIAVLILILRTLRSTKQGLLQKTVYGFYILLHPVGGFWDLRHENRGSGAGGLIIFGAAVISQTARSLFLNRQFTEKTSVAGAVQDLFQLAGIVVLFVLANWCLTTLIDGKAHLSDIFTVCCYALLPLIITNCLSISLSYLLSLNEALYISFINSIGICWTCLLFFSGIMTVQQYSFAKNVITTVLSIIGMAILTFIIILILTTVAQIFSVGHLIFQELIR